MTSSTSVNSYFFLPVEDYLSDVYTDVIEGYLIASIKVQDQRFLGWIKVLADTF